jgi:hypothetical protein
MKTARPNGTQGEDETMNSRSIRILMSGLLAMLAIGAVFASSAGAVPAWKFEGVSLEGTELTVGFGDASSLTIPSAGVKCEHFLYKMKISNSTGTGKGEVTELPLFNCTSTNPECTIEAMAAEKLPWPAHLLNRPGGSYVVVEKVKINVLYGGETCPLSETLIPVTGTAGASFENATEAAVFNSASFEETTTALQALGLPVQLEGVFPTEAFEWHRGQALSVS